MTVATPAQTSSTSGAATPVTPGLPAGHRLVPALIGRPGRAQLIHLPCPDWCVLSHAEERQVAVEDVSHRGDVDHVQVSTMDDDLYSTFELYSQLYSDPASEDPRMRVAAVTVTDGSRDAYLTPDMADETADELIAFAMRLKATAGAARLANQSVA